MKANEAMDKRLEDGSSLGSRMMMMMGKADMDMDMCI
jgi:hypothetical protein